MSDSMVDGRLLQGEREAAYGYGEWALVMASDKPDVEIDLGCVSERFRGVLEEIKTAESNMRRVVMMEWVDKQEDADALGKRIDAVGPDDPAPADDEPKGVIGIEGDDWPPLRLKEAHKAEPFPVEVLPPSLARLAVEGAESIGCPVDFVACSALALASGVIGRSASLLLKEGYAVSASLYIAIVGPPGDGKTPALSLAAEPIRGIGRQFANAHETAMAEWEDARAERDRQSDEPEPPEPVERHLDVGDVTTERLIGMIAENPRGLVMVRDELASLFGGMDQYRSGKGADRQFYCGVWSGASQSRHRVGRLRPESLRCDDPFLSIIGCMTPDLLETIADARGRADGLQDRFLFVYPEPRPVSGWSDRGVSQTAKDGWVNIIDRLWMRQMAASSEGAERPHIVQLTDEGRAAWREVNENHAAEINADGFPYAFRGPWAKLREYAGRLALVLSLVRLAAEQSASALATPVVDRRDVEDAWKLIAYFKSHAKRALDYGGPIGSAGVAAQAIVKWIRDRGLTSFTERDVKRARTWIEGEALEEALGHLAKKNAIRVQPSLGGSRGRGRPASPAYDVNPDLHSCHN